MTRVRDIYLLDPACLPPETIAVAFAKTSRSPLSFKQIAAELSDVKSADFHEKWVVGYGHSSVAEHAVLHIALENVSRLAVETIESCRLASYTEKSSRYQVWDSDQFYIPGELAGFPDRQFFYDTVRYLFELYVTAIPLVEKTLSEKRQRYEKESENSWQRRLRSESADVCRYLLPAAAMANVGMTINARALEHSIRKMLTSPIEEVRLIGEEIKSIAQQKVPTLVKYATPDEAIKNSTKAIRQHQPNHRVLLEETDWCRCVYKDEDAFAHMMAAALFSQNQIGFEETSQYVDGFDEEQKAKLLKDYLSPFGEHDIPPRELEHATFTFEVILDQGAYFELKRHRMMTQTPQTLNVNLGYAIPRLIEEAGLLSAYNTAMHKVRECFSRIEKWNPFVASYIVPNAFNRRVLLTMNYRSARHLIALRSAENAHFAMRRFAARLAEEFNKCSPFLGQYLINKTDKDWKTLEKDNFLSCCELN